LPPTQHKGAENSKGTQRKSLFYVPLEKYVCWPLSHEREMLRNDRYVKEETKTEGRMRGGKGTA
jgi:hypothetical protein